MFHSRRRQLRSLMQIHSILILALPSHMNRVRSFSRFVVVDCSVYYFRLILRRRLVRSSQRMQLHEICTIGQFCGLLETVEEMYDIVDRVAAKRACRGSNHPFLIIKITTPALANLARTYGCEVLVLAHGLIRS